MPYIQKDDRHGIDHGYPPTNPGELNYKITTVVNKYLKTRGEKYAVYNEIVGALECCKLELYRRMVAPYEDKKIEANGDVY